VFNGITVSVALAKFPYAGEPFVYAKHAAALTILAPAAPVAPVSPVAP